MPNASVITTDTRAFSVITNIFGHGGVKKSAKDMSLPFLGEIPIDLQIRIGGDTGIPLVEAHPDSPQSKAFELIASNLREQLGL